jgi:hypothetical protein
MDLLLVVAALVSLALAAVMSIVSWRLLRDGRDRSAARVAALEAMAFAEDADADADDDDVVVVPEEPRRAPALPAAQAAAHTSRPALIDDDFGGLEDDTWDLALRPDIDLPPVARRRVERDGRAVAVPDAMFHSAVEPGAPRRRWVALAVVVLVVAGGAATVYGLRSTNALSHFSLPASVTGGRAAQVEPLELLSLRHAADASGTFSVTGLVQNPSDGRGLTDVVAVVYLFDRQGQYFASGRAPLSQSLQPGEEAPFVITIPDAVGVGRYRVGFRHDDGGVVAHVDRRGHEPVGTTGGSIDEGDTSAVIPTSSPRRAEGN